MKTIKPNNLLQAQKELKMLSPILLEKIKDTIKVSDKHMYHVALIRIISKPGQMDNDAMVSVQTYHRHGFEKIARNYQTSGYNYCVVLHNPQKAEEIEEDEDEETEKPQGIDLAEIRSMKQAELIAYASEKGIDTGGETRVRQLQPIVLQWAKNQN